MCVCVLTVGSSIGRVKVMVFDSSMCVCVDCGFKHRSREAKNYKIDVCCFTQSVKLEKRLIVKIICPSGGTFL